MNSFLSSFVRPLLLPSGSLAIEMKFRRYKTTCGSRGDGPRKRNSPPKNDRWVELPPGVGPIGFWKFDGRETATYKAFERYFPRDRSLEKYCDVSPGPPDCIEFHAQVLLTLDMLEHFASSPSTVINAFPLYHGHVLWNCLPRITYADGEFTFSVVHNGPSLSHPPKTVDPTRSPPPVSIALLYVCFDKGCIVSEITPSARGEEIVFDKKFTLSDFEKAEDGRIYVRTILYVPRSYFDLATIIDLDASPPTVPDVMSRTVATVLRREKPDGADWTITVAERNFFVHSEAFASKSQQIQNIQQNDGLKRWSIEKICILHSALTADDMQVIIPLIYGAAVPLPRHDARLIPLVEDSIRQIFDAEYLQSFLAPQWERAICKRALALPLAVRSFFPVFRLLTIIWCFPRGWMPVAKRVAIGVMADIVHLHGGVNVNAFLRDQAAKIVPLRKEKDLDHWMAIMDSMLTHLYQVSSVLKNGPRDEMDEEEEEVDGWTYEERDGEDVNPATVNITPSEMVDPLFTEGSTVQVENANKIEQVASHTGEFHITFEADDSTFETREGQAKGEEFNAPAFTKESKKAVALSVEDEEVWHDEDPAIRPIRSANAPSHELP